MTCLIFHSKYLISDSSILVDDLNADYKTCQDLYYKVGLILDGYEIAVSRLGK